MHEESSRHLRYEQDESDFMSESEMKEFLKLIQKDKDKKKDNDSDDKNLA